MTDVDVAEAALPEPPAVVSSPRPEPGRLQAARPPLSAALFLLVVVAFALPFASTSCTVPGGFGRGAAGSSTVYRGLDIALDAVPAVTPSDRPERAGSLPDDGQLGFQPLALLALLGAIAGIPLSLLARTRSARIVGAWAVVTAAVLVAAQLEVVRELTDRIAGGLTQPLPRPASSYVSTGAGFVAALALLAVLAAANLVAALWTAARARR